jgi:outer membrane lipoprotein-sorting protein
MIRNPIVLVLAGTVLIVSALGFGAPQAGGTLEATLASMDKAAASFKGLTADVRRLSYTAVVEKTDVEEGTVAAKKMKKETAIKITMNKPEEKIYAIGGGKAWIYTPKSQEVEEANLGAKSKDLVNQLMLLAFGSNSNDLKAAYTVKLGGADAVNGEKTTRLELTPKSEEVLNHVKRCDMWISEKGMAVQQKFFTGGGDYVLTTYSQMKMVPNLPESAVKFDVPKGAKITKIK